MKDKLKAHYLTFGPKTFVLLATLILLVLDVINSYYLKIYWKAKDMSNTFIVSAAKMNSVTLEDLGPNTIAEMNMFIDKMFMFFLLIILANNLFFYFFYLRKKLWAQSYVLVYALTAALFSVTFVLDDAGLGMGWVVYNLLTIVIYAYLFMGIKLTKHETTLADEKKGR